VVEVVGIGSAISGDVADFCPRMTNQSLIIGCDDVCRAFRCTMKCVEVVARLVQESK
jgi:hypothetical protein